MIVIPAINVADGDVNTNRPSAEIPVNAVLVIFDGTENTYMVYEQGDELPVKQLIVD